jgi:hypothetical protein
LNATTATAPALQGTRSYIVVKATGSAKKVGGLGVSCFAASSMYLK